LLSKEIPEGKATLTLTPVKGEGKKKRIEGEGKRVQE